jgi:kumamolisin
MQNKKWQFLNRCIVVGAVAVLATVAVAQVGSTGRVSQEQMIPRTQQAGKVFVPESSKEQPGMRAHTTYVLHSVDGLKPTVMSKPTAMGTAGPLSLVQQFETPNSMGCIYVKSPNSSGCVPFAVAGGPSPAGYGAIAIVDAFDNPQAANDVAVFNAQWPLAATSFTKIYANGNGSCVTPPPDANWALEESLDIEWAHVFAPNAAIILVEACSNSGADLFYAEQVAFNYIVSNYPAGGQVTNSWQGGEFGGQIADDPFFADWEYNWATGYKTPILAFASSGDFGFGVGYPSTNPWLISAGGTSVYRNSTNNKFSKEGCWGGSGGGPSSVETYTTSFTGGNTGPWADYQYPIFGQSNRVTPDLSFNADPASGVYVYSGYNGGWFAVGGTSVSSPSLASIVNRSNNRLGSVFLTPFTSGSDWFNNEENNLLYSQIGTHLAYSANFYDVTTGSNGSAATKNYDECTGVGSPRGLLGK